MFKKKLVKEDLGILIQKLGSFWRSGIFFYGCIDFNWIKGQNTFTKSRLKMFWFFSISILIERQFKSA